MVLIVLSIDDFQNEFKKVVIKRQGQRLGENVNLMPGVTGSRLPLQKSVSTPSIASPPGQAAEPGSRVAPSTTLVLVLKILLFCNRANLYHDSFYNIKFSL